MTPTELDPELHDAISELADNADELADAGDYAAALGQYQKAFNLLPEPKNQWEAATWLLAAIADAHFLSGDNKSTISALKEAMTCPDAIGNPFLHLRYGQALFDENHLDAAADELIRAYMGAGAEIFESEDPSYFSFLKTRAIIP